MSKQSTNQEIKREKHLGVTKNVWRRSLLALLGTLCTLGGLKAQKVDVVFRDPADSSHDSYLVFLPEKEPVRGLLFLLDGFGGNDIPWQTTLPVQAAQRGLVNELRLLGNDRAQLVVTSGKGYREPGHRRHPHSWSIADPKTVLDWLLQPPAGKR